MKEKTTHIVALTLSALFAISIHAQQPAKSTLNIVDKVEIDVQRNMNQCTATQLSIDLSEALAKLTQADIKTSDIYTVEYDAGNDAAKDELSNETNNVDDTAVGWWYVELYDEATDLPTGQCCSSPFYEGETNIYIRDYTLEDKKLILCVGHNKHGVTAGNTYTAPLFIVIDNSAVEIDVKVKIIDTDPSRLNVADNNVTGSLTANLEIHYNGSYKYQTVSLPVDSLLSLLPQDVPLSSQWYEDYYALTLYGLESDGVLTDNSTANYGGFWFDVNGYVTEYSTSPSFFVEPDYYEGLNLLHVGIYPNYSAIGSTVSTTLYLWGQELYAININLTILPQVTMNDCEKVETLNYTVEIQTSTAGTGAYMQSEDMVDAIDLSEIIESTMGLDGTTFVALSYIPGTGYQTMSAAYQISVNSGIENAPNMGYQMMDLSYFVQQTGNDSFAHIAAPFNPLPILTAGYAIGYENGKLSFWQKDGTRKTGDYYTSKFVIFNTDEGKRIDLDITVVFVDQLNPKVDIVATQDLTLPKSDATGDDYATTAFDLSAVAEVLECNNTDDIKWLAYNELGQLLGTFDYDDIYGYTFNAEGKLTKPESEQAVFSIGYIDGEFHTLVSNGEADTDYNATIVAYYEGKGYVFNITLSSNSTAIDYIPATGLAYNATTYDISGRVVNTLVRGLYIQNGKKVLIK